MIESNGTVKYYICNLCRKEVVAPMPIDWEENWAGDSTQRYCGDCRKLSIADKVKMIIGKYIFEPELTTPFLSCPDDFYDINLLLELEDCFDFMIPDEDTEKMKTVGDVVRYIERKLEEE